MKKEILKIIVKVLIYALGLIAAFLGVSSVASCSVSRDFHHDATGYFQYYDTLRVHGNSIVKYPYK